MGAIPATGPTLGTRHPTPIRHIFTVTPRIAEEPASPFTLDLHITAIGTADPDIGITAGIVIGRSFCLTQVTGTTEAFGRYSRGKDARQKGLTVPDNLLGRFRFALKERGLRCRELKQL